MISVVTHAFRQQCNTRVTSLKNFQLYPKNRFCLNMKRKRTDLRRKANWSLAKHLVGETTSFRGIWKTQHHLTMEGSFLPPR